MENEFLDKNSLLKFYKDLITLRKNRPVLQQGTWIPVIKGEHDIITYLRDDAQDQALVVLNFENKTQKGSYPPDRSMEGPTLDASAPASGMQRTRILRLPL